VIAVVGAGRFGTALASVVAQKGPEVLLYSDDAEAIRKMRAEQRVHVLGGLALPPRVAPTSDLAQVSHARLVILCVPSPQVVATVRGLSQVVSGHHMLVHAVGGWAGALRVSELFRRETCVKRIGALAGPALPTDLMERRPCALVVASPFAEVVAEVRAALSLSDVLRVYGGRDLAGVELAGGISGALTVAVGLADGLAMGAGPRAVLVTRGVAEAARLGRRAGAEEKTFYGLAGLGNLLVRSSSASRESSDDYQLGVALGKGDTPKHRETAGSRAVLAAVQLARQYDVRTPILDAVVDVVHRGVPSAKAAIHLLETEADEE
jgi:glycerol-3-phosphate dehydrogenase (NAD(P)+)